MMKRMKKAQTMVEYIIIVCLIAVSLIAVFTYLSRAVGKRAAGATNALDSDSGSQAESKILDEPTQDFKKLDDVKVN